MNLRSLFPPLLVAVLASGCAAMPEYQVRQDLLGDPAPVTVVTRTIVITPGTRHVNVTGGETIKFVVGDKSFAWSFSGPQDVSSFDLNRVAPAGMLDHKVMAYVAPNPLYIHDGHN